MEVINNQLPIVLFKMPSPERIIYVQKLMDIIGSPQNLVVQLTTYRNKWVPEEIFNNPAAIEGQTAWIVCVDAKNVNRETVVQRFIPIREVKIVKAKKNLDTLMLWLELHGFLKCTDYQAFRKELEATEKPLPPKANSFILSQAKVTSVQIVDSTNEQLENSIWKEIVDGLSTMEVFRNSVFYRIISLFDGNKQLSPKSINENEEPHSYYQVTVNKYYALKIHYYLPEKQFEFCPQPIKCSSENDWIKFYGDNKIKDRINDLNITFSPQSTSDQHPYKGRIWLSVSVDSPKLISPKIELDVNFSKESLIPILKRNRGMLIWSIIFIGFFIFGELLALFYPTVNGVSPLWEGFSIATISSAFITFAIATIPVALALWRRK